MVYVSNCSLDYIKLLANYSHLTLSHLLFKLCPSFSIKNFRKKEHIHIQSTDIFDPLAQENSMDSFHSQISIDSSYVDGISVTYGSPRKHIWTFATGLSTTVVVPHKLANCPCSEHPGQKPSTFVGSDYYCESGNPSATSIFDGWYTANRLWDGSCANTKSKCCNHPTMPYFIQNLGATSTEPLEVRLCTNQHTDDENFGVEKLELYIR